MNFAQLTPEQQQQVIQQGARRYKTAPTADQLMQNAALATQLMQAVGIMPTTDADVVRQGIDWLDASGMPSQPQSTQPAAKTRGPTAKQPAKAAATKGAGNEQPPSPPRRPTDLQKVDGSTSQQATAKVQDDAPAKAAPKAADAGNSAPTSAKAVQPSESLQTMDGYEALMAPQAAVTPAQPEMSPEQIAMIKAAQEQAMQQQLQAQTGVAENPRTKLAPADNSWRNTIARAIRDIQSKVRMDPNNPARAIRRQQS